MSFLSCWRCQPHSVFDEFLILRIYLRYFSGSGYLNSVPPPSPTPLLPLSSPPSENIIVIKKRNSPVPSALCICPTAPLYCWWVVLESLIEYQHLTRGVLRIPTRLLTRPPTDRFETARGHILRTTVRTHNKTRRVRRHGELPSLLPALSLLFICFIAQISVRRFLATGRS